jgi:hypothetical protein
MKMDKNIQFDAVQMMRDIREELSEKYWQHPDILKQEMEAIRQKYHMDIHPPHSYPNHKKEGMYE